jgi:hypothetical protein
MPSRAEFRTRDIEFSRLLRAVNAIGNRQVQPPAGGAGSLQSWPPVAQSCFAMS